MGFVSGFPLTQHKHDSVWVIIDALTKSSHFIPVRMDYSMDRLTELYVEKIVRLHHYKKKSQIAREISLAI